MLTSSQVVNKVPQCGSWKNEQAGTQAGFPSVAVFPSVSALRVKGPKLAAYVGHLAVSAVCERSQVSRPCDADSATPKLWRFPKISDSPWAGFHGVLGSGPKSGLLPPTWDSCPKHPVKGMQVPGSPIPDLICLRSSSFCWNRPAQEFASDL